MKPLLGLRRARNLAPVAVILAALAVVYLPSAIGFSGGMNSESQGFPAQDFDQAGCTVCHGPGSSAPHEFAPPPDKVTIQVLDSEGNQLTSGGYVHEETYTINITLRNEIAPDADNHAGFHLSASGGELEAIDGTNIQITGGGLEASHTDASATQWSVRWTAPEAGAIAFRVHVNDVDGSGNADAGDHVYRHYFGLTDENGALLGAALDEEVHFGVALPQYWLGLIALASMIFVILFAFVYLKFVNPHNTDPKDR